MDPQLLTQLLSSLSRFSTGMLGTNSQTGMPHFQSSKLDQLRYHVGSLLQHLTDGMMPQGSALNSNTTLSGAFQTPDSISNFSPWSNVPIAGGDPSRAATRLSALSKPFIEGNPALPATMLPGAINPAPAWFTSTALPFANLPSNDDWRNSLRQQTLLMPQRTPTDRSSGQGDGFRNS